MVLLNKTRNVFTVLLLLASINSSALFAQTDVKVRATTLEPAHQAAYIFKVVFDSDVSLSSHIEIVFPPAFNLNSTVLAASDKLDGTLTVKKIKSSLLIKRVNAQTPIRAGEPVDFRIASILNPNEMNRDWSFKVIVRENDREIEQKELTTKVEQLTTVN